MPISFDLNGDEVCAHIGGKHFWTYKLLFGSLDFCRYNGRLKAWTFPINLFSRITPLLSTLPEIPALSGDLYERLTTDRAAREHAMHIRSVEETEFRPEGFNGTLLGFQAIGSEFLIRGRRAILGDDVGLGKTVQALGSVTHLLEREEIDSILIVAPGHLKRQWAKEIGKFTFWECEIIEGGRRQREWQLRQDKKIFITNYELLARDPEYIGKEWGAVILDEAQAVKNWKSQTARLVKKIKAGYKWALTATPLENSLPELHSILECVNPGLLGPWWEFERRFVIRDMWGGIKDHKNLDELKEIIKPYLLRRRVEDCLSDFPEKESKIATMKLSRSHRVIYLDVAKRVVQTLSDRGAQINAAQRMNQVGYLRQACDDPRLISPEFGSCGSVKLKWLKETLEKIRERGDKAVVFTEWSRMVNILREELNVDTTLTGKLGFAVRHEVLERWKRGDDPLITTDCSNVGLNLQDANWLINFEMHWNPAVMKQRAGRVYRLTQEKKIFVRAPMIQDTVEEKVCRALAGKINLFKNVVDGLASTARKESRNARNA